MCIRDKYGATMIQALKTVLPVKQKMKQKEERWIRLLLEKDEAENQLELCRKKHYVARQRLLEALLENDMAASRPREKRRPARLIF